MTIEITNGSSTITPWGRGILRTSANEAQNIFATDIDGNLVVTLRPDARRSGTLPLFFESASEADAARTALATYVGAWTLTDDVPELNMTFVRSGPLATVQQDARKRWVLEVGFQEVNP